MIVREDLRPVDSGTVGGETALSAPVERTLVFIKPDGVARGLIGEILARLERKGLSFVGLKLVRVSRRMAEKHYAEHKGKPFYPGLLKFITSGPVVVMAVEGPEAIAAVRNLVGLTSGFKALPGTIRGDFALSGRKNLVHASDGPESAARELALWFEKSELLAQGKGTGIAPLPWVYGQTV
jgi:nucleoside-diphosphate kinase